MSDYSAIRDAARAYFAGKGLTYDDITEGDILALVMLLNKSVKKANAAHEMSTDTMRMSQKIEAKYRTNGKLIYCNLYINSHYFTQRQAISLEGGGWIGFAGWAADNNVKPIIDAFIQWCDYLAEGKEAQSA